MPIRFSSFPASPWDNIFQHAICGLSGRVLSTDVHVHSLLRKNLVPELKWIASGLTNTVTLATSPFLLDSVSLSANDSIHLMLWTFHKKSII